MGLIQTQSVDEYMDEQEAQEQQSSLASLPVSALASMVHQHWSVAKQNRTELNERLLDCLRRRKGEYSPQKLSEIKSSGMSDIFMQITGAKCRAAKAWLSDLFNPAGERAWTLNPTPVPDLPPDLKQKLVHEAMRTAREANMPPQKVQEVFEKHKDRLMDELKQEAEDRAEKLAEVIEDFLVEGNWREEFDDFLDDFVTYPFAVMKGIEFHRSKKLVWRNENGQYVPAMGEQITPAVRRVSPFRSYPAPSVSKKLDGHWHIEHHSFTRSDLSQMRDAPGYDNEALAQVLLQYSTGGLREWVWDESERARLEGKSTFWASSTDEIDALEWSGSVQGQTLLNEGFPAEKIADPLEEYQVSITVIGPYVVRFVINFDPSGKPDYHKACWISLPGSFVGVALPESIADCQDTCNASARSLINNMGYASGPMVGMYSDQLAPGQNIAQMHPWKIFQFQDAEGAQNVPIQFFQPQSHASELLTIYERFSRYADEISGLPAYAYGSDSAAGAGRTASGLSMLMNAASKTIKHAIRDIDLHVIEPIVTKFFNFIMLTHEDQSIKGDASIKARGSESLIHKEQSTLRQQELLAMTNNPVDLQIMGDKGRLNQLREVMKSGDIPVDRILPTIEEYTNRTEQQNEASAKVQQEAEELEKALKVAEVNVKTSKAAKDQADAKAQQIENAGVVDLLKRIQSGQA